MLRHVPKFDVEFLARVPIYSHSAPKDIKCYYMRVHFACCLHALHPLTASSNYFTNFVNSVACAKYVNDPRNELKPSWTPRAFWMQVKKAYSILLEL